MPVVAIPRKGLGFADLVWLLPTMVHLSMVLSRPLFVQYASPYLTGWSPVAINHTWGFIVQFCSVGFWGGDAFNFAGLAVRTELGPSRFVRMILQLAAGVLFAHTVYLVMGEAWANTHVRDALPAIKVCGISDGGKSACETNYCDILDGLRGTCTVNKAGCCIPPHLVVLDEIRHVVWFPLMMRLLGPYFGWTILTPFFASVFQLMVRLFPSGITGAWVNPSPHFLRAYMTGDFSYLHLIYAGTIGAQIVALILATIIKYVLSLVFGGGGGG
eukprot:CAMPEP_0173390502 /NCGR_PEP_ID=MMETSP1356-20130122/15105_1 /TAXON_ID=77927 ORGANISM="Hemiselmis virescens, Strain PCC157" /NCGR_SAMPLE_ID=MMETSP1356 /ASSEMBLY_ACC=CAM_ASM_000847 /LENGTH=271 /DNA_ID=CAMNT_0014347913 /DNA_START=50 /DNA_END=862 /DNA_ORIENTATION=+